MKNLIRFIIKIFYKVFYRVKISGIENIPQNEGVIVAPNHLSNHDPIVIGVYYPRMLYSLAKKELFVKPWSKLFFTYMNAFPVYRDGSDLKAIKKSLQVLKNNDHLMIFPEGKRNYEDFPAEGKAGVPMIAIKAKVKLLPVSIWSTYKLFSKINIVFHEPIDYAEFYDLRLSTDEYIELSNKLLQKIYEGRIKY
jgi:1-acyl-sn-glycerol-3-phosphate acyltransferase